MGLPPEVATAPEDSRFGKFVRILKLGAGGMGEVWKAWDTGLSRWVALKFTKSVDQEDLERFRREAEMAARLSHPNIASIYEIGDAGGRPWIAMQFVEGRTLKSRRASAREAALWIRDVARAVHVAHRQGVIHRDLKPDNVMVDDTGRVFVMDFGLARPVDSGPGLTQSGTAVGTPSYMPPEQALGKATGPRSDVYGLGATLYELLAGRPPFAGPTVLEVLTAVCQEEPARIAGAERDLETIAFKCLEKDTERRYASAGDVADDIERWLGGEPILARPPSAGYRLGKLLRRRWAVAVAAFATVVVAISAAAWWWRTKADHDRITQREEARRRDLEATAATLERARPAISRAERLRGQGAPQADVVKAVQEARTHIESAAAIVTTPLVHHLRGVCSELEGDDAGAEAAWRLAIEADGTFVVARYRLGMLLVTRAMNEVIATSAAETAMRGGTVRRYTDEAAAHLEAAAGGLQDELLRDIARGAGALSRGKADAAVDALQASLTRNAGREGVAEGYTLLSQMYSRGPRRTAAIDAALKESPGHPQARFYRGVESAIAGDMKSALDDFTRVVDARPRFLWGHVNRATALKRLGNPKEALEEYRRALEIEPAHVQVMASMAETQRDSGDVAGALKTVEQGFAMAPRSAELFEARGAIKQRQGDRRGAIADYGRALEINPDYIQALANRGLCRVADGDMNGIEDLDRALKVDPEHGFSRHWRGVARKRNKDMQGALEDFAVAVKVWPHNAPSWFQYATTLVGLGRQQEAMPAFERCIALDPRHADAYASRALAKRTLGDRAGALADVEKALDVGEPDWINRAAAERLRDQLKN